MRAQGPVLVLPPSLAEALGRRAGRAAPKEACGLLLGREEGECHRVVAAQELDNRAPDPGISFRMGARDLARGLAFGLRRGWGILGTWHSHPRGPAFPSAADEGGLLGGGNLLLWAPGRGGQGELRCFRRASGPLRAPLREIHLGFSDFWKPQGGANVK